MRLQPVNTSLAAVGNTRIDWAKPLMPVLADSAMALAESGIVEGKHIVVCLPMDAKMANLAMALSDVGARVSCWAPAHASEKAIIHALRQNDISVFTGDSGNTENDLINARALLASSPDIILDNGAEIIQLAHSEFPEIF